MMSSMRPPSSRPTAKATCLLGTALLVLVGASVECSGPNRRCRSICCLSPDCRSACRRRCRLEQAVLLVCEDYKMTLSLLRLVAVKAAEGTKRPLDALNSLH